MPFINSIIIDPETQVFFLLILACVFLIFFLHGLQLYIACKTRKDPDIPVPDTMTYIHKKTWSDVSMFIGLLGWAAVVYFQLDFGFYIVCIWTIVVSFVVIGVSHIVQKMRLEPYQTKNGELTDDNIHQFDFNTFMKNQTIRKRPDVD